jgi:6-phosphofructokinase 1
MLATRFGVMAAELALAGHSGQMVALQGTQIVSVPLEQATHQTSLVSPDGQLVHAARAIGISFGD